MNLSINKKQLLLNLILILYLGISIFCLFHFYQNQTNSQNHLKITPQIARVIFKEHGIEMQTLFKTSQLEFTESAKTLNHLKILNNQISFLDGLPLQIDNRIQIPLAVVVENHTLSRPQMAGLNEAKIVYEALVEGGITRFLAVFDPNSITKIGPIRSARPYFIHWAEEFGGIFVHIGGSEEALAYLKNSSSVIDTGENENEDIIWRDLDYPKPHNAFTSTRKLYNRFIKFNWKKQIQKPVFKFKVEETPAVDEIIQRINLDFSLPNYHVKWVYSQKNNNYLRYQAGKRHNSIEAKNIIIQILPNALIENDPKGRLEMPVLGTGKAIYFLDGMRYEGAWVKEDYDTKTLFYDKDGSEMRFNRGKTWIEVIDFAWKIKSE